MTGERAFQMGDLEVFGIGVTPFAHYISRVIDLGADANFGPVQIYTRTDSLATTLFSTKTGNTADDSHTLDKQVFLVNLKKSPVVNLTELLIRRMLELFGPTIGIGVIGRHLTLNSKTAHLIHLIIDGTFNLNSNSYLVVC